MDLRHEWKHEISYLAMLSLRQRLRAVARPDPHAVDGRYLIRSLYFDTPSDQVLREKLSGVSRREKFRIRYYNGDTSIIHLEKKSKVGGLGNKQSAALAVIGSVVIGVILLVFVNKKPCENPYIVVLQCADRGAELQAQVFLENSTRRCVVKSKSVQKGAIELNMEVRLKDDNTDFINALAEREGVLSAVLVSYNGDYMG